MVRHQNGKPTPSYKNHRALDDKAGVVTAVKTTTGAMDEASELFELIERHERVTASKTKVAVADSRYGNTANLIALAQRQIRAHVADLRSKLRNPRSQGIYAPERFVYQSETDCYRCPAGRDPFSTPLCCGSRLLRVSPQAGNLRAMQPPAVLHAG